jgi:serine/threonine-protein kinase
MSMQLPNIGDLLLGKYRLERALGEGGMGIVFAAHHDLLGQRVAVKLIRPEFATHAEAAARFLNEARAAARIESDHIARVLDVGTLESGLPYMVLEYLDGSDLAQVLHERGPLGVADCADYLLQAIEAVASAHALGIIHRDLKPSNLFLARRPDGLSRVKVLDFGIAKVLGAGHGAHASVTRTNTVVGSPLYMSPEQLLDSKSVNHSSDIWAMGVVAYELLTGRPPFMADNPVALFAAIQVSEPASMCVSRPELGGHLDAVILKCLRRLPEERYSSMTELAASLAPFGTVIGASAFENAKRILPLKPPPPSAAPRTGASDPHFEHYTKPSHERIAALPHATTVLPTVQEGRSEPAASAPRLHVAASTAEPWSTSPPVLPMYGRPGRRGLAIFGIAGLLAAVIATAIAVFPRAGQQRGMGSGSPGASGASGTARVEPTASASSASSSNFASSPASSAVVGASSVTEASQKTVILPANTKPPATASPPDLTAAATAARPKATAVAAPPPPSRPNCSPPYEFDATGKKIWKRECP